MSLSALQGAELSGGRWGRGGHLTKGFTLPHCSILNLIFADWWTPSPLKHLMTLSLTQPSKQSRCHSRHLLTLREHLRLHHCSSKRTSDSSRVLTRPVGAPGPSKDHKTRPFFLLKDVLVARVTGDIAMYGGAASRLHGCVRASVLPSPLAPPPRPTRPRNAASDCGRFVQVGRTQNGGRRPGRVGRASGR